MAPATVAHFMRMPDQSKSVDPSLEWIVLHGADTPVCPLCLLEDDEVNRPRYRRIDWNLAWLTRCSVHRTPLIRLPNWATAPVRAWRNPRFHRRSASGRIVQVAQRRRQVSASERVPIRIANNAVNQIERTIRAALMGRKPRADRWGNLSAKQFLDIFEDVSSFVLTRFSHSKALCTTDTGYFIDHAPVRFFTRVSRPTYQSYERYGVASLEAVGDVGLRRCALFWTRELMHIDTARPWLPINQQNSRFRRLDVALHRQPIEAQGWLAQRALEWPDEYRTSWWADMAAIR